MVTMLNKQLSIGFALSIYVTVLFVSAAVSMESYLSIVCVLFLQVFSSEAVEYSLPCALVMEEGRHSAQQELTFTMLWKHVQMYLTSIQRKQKNLCREILHPRAVLVSADQGQYWQQVTPSCTVLIKASISLGASQDDICLTSLSLCISCSFLC